MIKCLDDFLPEGVFQQFVAESLQFSSQMKSGGAHRAVTLGDPSKIRDVMGLKWDIFYKKLAQAVSPLEIAPNCCKVQSIIDDEVNWHWDGAIPPGDPKATKNTSYTGILYTHAKWQPRAGGAGRYELRTGESFEPMPNRALIYSRDLEHRVIPGDWGGVRSFALISFYEVNR